MSLDEKRDLLLEKFPLCGLGERMASQLDYLFHPKLDESHNLILLFAFWDETKEGYDFWDDIHNLYGTYTNPNESQITEIFNKHLIAIPL